MKTEAQKKIEDELTIIEQRVDALIKSVDDVRSNTIEEVAQHIEKLTAFGADTIDGLAIYIREMKK